MLENIVATVLPIWPHMLLPNNLIKGLRTLAEQAGIELHLFEMVKLHGFPYAYIRRQYAFIRRQYDYNEALEILTTQTLAQLFELGLTFDCVKLAALTWSRIIAMITDANKCWGPSTYPTSWAITECIPSRLSQASLQLEMDVTIAWWQFIYYVSRVDNKMGLLTGLKVLNKRSLACRRVIATHDYCVEKILQPLIDVENGSLPVKPPPLFDIRNLKW
ncbi:MAG: hypothetical protein EBU46_18735 [Nitrosomonadaceae bacterium]|nr:hypothetical protein [Nitrosomonadaceae bacterium]